MQSIIFFLASIDSLILKDDIDSPKMVNWKKIKIYSGKESTTEANQAHWYEQFVFVFFSPYLLETWKM